MKRQLAALLLTIFALSLTACGETAAESETRTVYAMDTVMNLTVYGENAAAALESAEKELHTLDEAVLSRTAEGSELYALNTSNGETVEYGADDILPALIETALTISDATDGAFDPTLAPVLDAWGFTKDERRVPSADELKELLSHTGCGKVALEKTADGWTVTLLDGAHVHTGGHDELIRRRYDAKVALRVRRVLDGDAPIAAVGLSPHDEHITAEVECRGRDALLFKLRAQKIRRVALGDAAEVELRAV